MSNFFQSKILKLSNLPQKMPRECEALNFFWGAEEAKSLAFVWTRSRKRCRACETAGDRPLETGYLSPRERASQPPPQRSSKPLLTDSSGSFYSLSDSHSIGFHYTRDPSVAANRSPNWSFGVPSISSFFE